MPQHRIHIQTPNDRNARNDFYWTGNPEGEVILLMGSCRIIPYLNYLYDLDLNYKIYCILPYAFNEQQLIDLEQNEQLKEIFSKTKIFIKEYHANYGIFNTLDKHEKNIYQFGMSPDLDITIPAWNDHFVFVKDIKEWHKETDRDNIFKIATDGYDKFFSNCNKTSIPEFAEYFFDNFSKKRLAWNFNHITKDYSLEVFRMINEKFLHFKLTEDFEKYKNVEHLAGNFTELTDLDREFFSYLWA